MNAQILLNCGKNWFEFSKSKTGQIDYVGKWENNELPKVEGYQKFASSTFFSPSQFIYLEDTLNNNPKIYVDSSIDVSDKDTFDFLVHVGPLLSAIEAKDSLLAGELYISQKDSFEKFAHLSSFIMDSLSVEILFSLCYGKMKNVNPDEIPLIFNNAKKKLNFDPSKETLDQAFIRYMKNNEVTLTLPLVGTQFYDWEPEPSIFDKLTDNLGFENLLGKGQKIRNAKHDFYADLETVVQAEPYNPYDKNSILVCIENIDSKICGNPGLDQAGHIRALAAKVIRESKEEKMSFNSKLVSLSYSGIVVQVTI